MGGCGWISTRQVRQLRRFLLRNDQLLFMAAPGSGIRVIMRSPLGDWAGSPALAGMVLCLFSRVLPAPYLKKYFGDRE